MDRIVHATAVDIGGGRRGFRSKDTVAGVPGTVVTATHLNATQEEIVRTIEKAGMVPSGADLEMLLKAVRSHAMNYRAASGTVNALTVTLDPVPATHDVRFLIVTPATTNTGAATLNDGAGALPIKNPLGADVAAGDIVAGIPFAALCTGTIWVHLGAGFVPKSRLLSAGWGVQSLGDLSANRTVALDQAALDARYAVLGILIARAQFDPSISTFGGDQKVFPASQVGGTWNFSTRTFTFTTPLNNANYFVEMMIAGRRLLYNVSPSGGMNPYVDMHEPIIGSDITAQTNAAFTVAGTTNVEPNGIYPRTLTAYDYIRVYKGS